ncbi:MAG: hypothetical protein EBU46_17440, partial [Nitrosomonadaceae bacterium]|nr:hypothetical protein [Nitrosomonadaceae bacterium]
MGRPKFLSDQLFNKPLFGSVYQSRQDWDEAGPAVGIGKARGYNVGLDRASPGRVLRGVQESMAALYHEYISIVGNPAGLAAMQAQALALRAQVVAGTYDGVVAANAQIVTEPPLPGVHSLQVGAIGKEAANCVVALLDLYNYVEQCLDALVNPVGAANIAAVNAQLAAIDAQMLLAAATDDANITAIVPNVMAIFDHVPVPLSLEKAGLQQFTLKEDIAFRFIGLTIDTTMALGGRAGAVGASPRNAVNIITAPARSLIAHWAPANFAPRLMALAEVVGLHYVPAAITQINTRIAVAVGTLMTAGAAIALNAVGPVFARAAPAARTPVNRGVFVVSAAVEAVVNALARGPSETVWAEKLINTFYGNQSILVSLLLKVPNSTPDANPMQQRTNQAEIEHLARLASVRLPVIGGNNNMVNDVGRARRAFTTDGIDGAGEMTIPFPIPAPFTNANKNPIARVVAFVLNRYIDQPGSDVANIDTAIMRMVGSLIEQRGAAGAGANRRDGPYVNNNGVIVRADAAAFIAALDRIAAKLRIEYVDSTGFAVAALVPVGPLAAPIAVPLTGRDRILPGLDEGPRYTGEQRARPVGAASLTWLGPEVPADDD